MKLGIYDIINDPLPQLYKIKDIIINKNDCYEHDNIVKMLNKHLKMDKLSTEHFYALALTYDFEPKAILQINIGDNRGVNVDMKKLGTGLLLSGGERFLCFHNHPENCRNISQSDINITRKIETLAEVIGIYFDAHIMITKGFWNYCKGTDDDADLTFEDMLRVAQ